jgi:hypothetical protein
MGVTRWNLKPIVKGSGRYHRKRWNVQELVPLDTIKRAIADQFRERIPWTATRPWIETSLQETLTSEWHRAIEQKIQAAVAPLTDEVTTAIQARLQAQIREFPGAAKIPGGARED